MKKGKLLLLNILIVVLFYGFTVIPAFAADMKATVSNTTMYVNDNYATINGYNINGNNYFKLRDVAYAMNDTSSSFNVTWDDTNKRIELVTNNDYLGKAPDSKTSGKNTTAIENHDTIAIDGKVVSLTAYNINGNNYFKLRDLGEALGFSVDWCSGESEYISIYTGMNNGIEKVKRTTGTKRYSSYYEATSNWLSTSKDYIMKNTDGTISTLMAIETDNGRKIYLDTYSQDYSNHLYSKEIPIPLDDFGGLREFGGFYAGEKYNYIVFGSENRAETPSVSVLQVVQYDKNFNQLNSISLTTEDCYTKEPFHSGNCSISEGPDGLVIHTSRLRPLTDDGLNHQSQLTVVIDPNTMQVKNELSAFQGNHVSHSFTQRVQYSGNHYVLVDHGDAYPRAVVMHKYNGSSYDEVTLFKISGVTGDNFTGVKLGGFEVTANNYLVAISSMNQDSKNSKERDVILLVSEKSNKDSNSVKQVKLTNYIGNDTLAGEPKLVRLSNNQFLVMWEEYYKNGANYNGVKYVLVDENGNKLNDVQTLKEGHLSGCQPIYVDGNVVWYCDCYDTRLIYKVGPFTANGDITETKEAIAVTEISLNKTDAILAVGETLQLQTTITPNDATNQNSAYQSSNSAVATVASNGLVTAKSAGTAMITAKTSNGKTASCTIRVTATQNPQQNTQQQETTQQQGTAQQQGNTQQQGTTQQQENVPQQNVQTEVTRVSVVPIEITLNKNEQQQLVTTLYPANANNKTVVYSSSDPSIVSVLGSGLMRAQSSGTATITATAANGVSGKCVVHVQSNVTGIFFDENYLTLEKGDTQNLILRIYPLDATDKTISYRSNNTNVVSVDNTGLVTAKKAGSTTIVATSNNGMTAKCTITVKDAAIGGIGNTSIGNTNTGNTTDTNNNNANSNDTLNNTATGTDLGFGTLAKDQYVEFEFTTIDEYISVMRQALAYGRQIKGVRGYYQGTELSQSNVMKDFVLPLKEIEKEYSQINNFAFSFGTSNVYSVQFHYR